MDYERVRDLEEIARKSRVAFEQRTNPESIYSALMNIIEGYADKCHHSAERGMLRNNGIIEICAQLNNLQKELTFQAPYKVKCDLVKKP